MWNLQDGALCNSSQRLLVNVINIYRGSTLWCGKWLKNYLSNQMQLSGIGLGLQGLTYDSKLCFYVAYF